MHQSTPLLLVLWSFFYFMFFDLIKTECNFIVLLKKSRFVFFYFPFNSFSSASVWLIIVFGPISLFFVFLCSFHRIEAWLEKTYTNTLNGSFNWLFKLGYRLGVQLLPSTTVSESSLMFSMKYLFWNCREISPFAQL